VGILLHYTGSGDALYKSQGAAIHYRHLRSVNLDQHIIDAHTREGGEHVFYRTDLGFAIADGCAAVSGNNLHDISVQHRLIFHIDPDKADAVIGLSGFKFDDNRLAGMQAYSLQAE